MSPLINYNKLAHMKKLKLYLIGLIGLIGLVILVLTLTNLYPINILTKYRFLIVIIFIAGGRVLLSIYKSTINKIKEEKTKNDILNSSWFLYLIIP